MFSEGTDRSAEVYVLVNSKTGSNVCLKSLDEISTVGRAGARNLDGLATGICREQT